MSAADIADIAVQQVKRIRELEAFARQYESMIADMGRALYVIRQHRQVMMDLLPAEVYAEISDAMRKAGH